jgi:hypothetical protein
MQPTSLENYAPAIRKSGAAPHSNWNSKYYPILTFIEAKKPASCQKLTFRKDP